MKIFLLVDRYPPRPHTGIGTFVQTIARGLHQRGHKVTVIDVGDENYESNDRGIPVITLKRSQARYVGNLITRIRIRQWLTSRFKANEIDVIELADYPGYLSFPIEGCPTVVRLHQSDTVCSVLGHKKATKGVWFYEKRNLTENSNWIGVSSHVIGLTEAIFQISRPKRSVVIHNPVPPAPSTLPEVPALPDNFVLFAGEVAIRKGALVLAEAACEFLHSHPGLHLVFVGAIRKEEDEPLSDKICRIVGPTLRDRVHFLGGVNRETVLACMKRARVFAFPAQLDCFPTTVLEAMSCGTPVVFTARPPGPEMIEDGITGLLADPTSAKDFSNKVSRVLDDPQLARRLAIAAREQVAERFSLEKCIEATEQFYSECMRS